MEEKKWLQPGVSEIVTRKISASKCARHLTVYNISSMQQIYGTHERDDRIPPLKMRRKYSSGLIDTI
jgi:hypothetical protein